MTWTLSEREIEPLAKMLNGITKDLSPVLQHRVHIDKLSYQLIFFSDKGVDRLPPFFSEECTPSIEGIVFPFLQALEQWRKDLEIGISQFVRAFETTSLRDILLILGQRYTSSSIKDARAIPPLPENLEQAFNKTYKHALTIGARAWCKHVNRTAENFWGLVKGNDQVKNQQANQILTQILDRHTWWNVFEHYKHGLVYEARLPSGHGARWDHTGHTFIGFLEPFLDA